MFDHGLLSGDGVFEEIRVYNRRVFKLEHISRLYDSANQPNGSVEIDGRYISNVRERHIADMALGGNQT